MSGAENHFELCANSELCLPTGGTDKFLAPPTSRCILFGG